MTTAEYAALDTERLEAFHDLLPALAMAEANPPAEILLGPRSWGK